MRSVYPYYDKQGQLRPYFLSSRRIRHQRRIRFPLRDVQHSRRRRGGRARHARTDCRGRDSDCRSRGRDRCHLGEYGGNAARVRRVRTRRKRRVQRRFQNHLRRAYRRPRAQDGRQRNSLRRSGRHCIQLGNTRNPQVSPVHASGYRSLRQDSRNSQKRGGRKQLLHKRYDRTGQRALRDRIRRNLDIPHRSRYSGHCNFADNDQLHYGAAHSHTHAGHFHRDKSRLQRRFLLNFDNNFRNRSHSATGIVDGLCNIPDAPVQSGTQDQSRPPTGARRGHTQVRRRPRLLRAHYHSRIAGAHCYEVRDRFRPRTEPCQGYRVLAHHGALPAALSYAYSRQGKGQNATQVPRLPLPRPRQTLHTRQALGGYRVPCTVCSRVLFRKYA